MTRQTLNMDIPNIYTEVADVQGMYLDISSYDILGLNRSIGNHTLWIFRSLLPYR